MCLSEDKKYIAIAQRDHEKKIPQVSLISVKSQYKKSAKGVEMEKEKIYKVRKEQIYQHKDCQTDVPKKKCRISPYVDHHQHELFWSEGSVPRRVDWGARLSDRGAPGIEDEAGWH